MTEHSTIHVTITADTRRFRQQLIRAQLVMECKWWKRLRLRFDLWRVNRELERGF